MLSVMVPVSIPALCRCVCVCLACYCVYVRLSVYLCVRLLNYIYIYCVCLSSSYICRSPGRLLAVAPTEGCMYGTVRVWQEITAPVTQSFCQVLLRRCPWRRLSWSEGDGNADVITMLIMINGIVRLATVEINGFGNQQFISCSAPLLLL